MVLFDKLCPHLGRKKFDSRYLETILCRRIFSFTLRVRDSDFIVINCNTLLSKILGALSSQEEETFSVANDEKGEDIDSPLSFKEDAAQDTHGDDKELDESLEETVNADELEALGKWNILNNGVEFFLQSTGKD